MKASRSLSSLALAVLLAGGTLPYASCTSDAGAEARPAQEPAFRVLVFTKTEGFRHDSIPDGIAAVERLGAEHGFAVDATEDASVFTSDSLGQYDAIVFLSTTMDVLDEAQEEGFKAYIQGGGGFAGIHAASDTEYEWPWYGELVGAYFDSHPQQQEATIRVVDRTHPSTAHLPEDWVRFDEWYNFKAPPKGVTILAYLDETTYEGGNMGTEAEAHPFIWYHEFDGGRAWYTGGGHTKESFTDSLFTQHMLGGIQWAAGHAEVN